MTVDREQIRRDVDAALDRGQYAMAVSPKLLAALLAELEQAERHPDFVKMRDTFADYYRVELGGEPDSPNMLRADRARSLYEQISDDFLNGRSTVPTMRERAESAEAQLAKVPVLVAKGIAYRRWRDLADAYPGHEWHDEAEFTEIQAQLDEAQEAFDAALAAFEQEQKP